MFPSTDLRRKILAVNYSLYWVASVCLAPGPGEQACKLLHLNTTMQEGVVLTTILKEGDLRLGQVKCPHSLSWLLNQSMEDHLWPVLGTHTLRGAQEHGLAQRTRLGSESTLPAP